MQHLRPGRAHLIWLAAGSTGAILVIASLVALIASGGDVTKLLTVGQTQLSPEMIVLTNQYSSFGLPNALKLTTADDVHCAQKSSTSHCRHHIEGYYAGVGLTVNLARNLPTAGWQPVVTDGQASSYTKTAAGVAMVLTVQPADASSGYAHDTFIGLRSANEY